MKIWSRNYKWKTINTNCISEDTVSKVKEVEVLDRTTKFYQDPSRNWTYCRDSGSFEYGGGTTAQATVNIGADGRISDVTVTEPIWLHN